ncbi:hypothetical protein EPI10_025849 [Gossypium australe]|uniref:Uncharacterized protein n=1 Tax=Gossypium australe TaxID=47621 RepID=A0A5B6W1E4_9ROSI|nr:hypothetical protein EPI10_025849 [Gossypium australe]
MKVLQTNLKMTTNAAFHLQLLNTSFPTTMIHLRNHDKTSPCHGTFPSLSYWWNKSYKTCQFY